MLRSNSFSYPLNDEDVTHMKASELIGERLVETYRIFLDFLGMVLVDPRTGAIDRSPAYKERCVAAGDACGAVACCGRLLASARQLAAFSMLALIVWTPLTSRGVVAVVSAGVVGAVVVVVACTATTRRWRRGPTTTCECVASLRASARWAFGDTRSRSCGLFAERCVTCDVV
jgi:hypothetical protein